MSSGKGPIFYAVSLILQLEFAVAAVAAGCTNNNFHGRPDCKEECSKPPRIEFGKGFPCKVGYNVEWVDFQNRYKTWEAKAMKSNFSVCKPLLMTKISLYPLPYVSKKKFSPSLKVTFDVRFIGQRYKPETKAVLLRFESPDFASESDKKYTDNLFSVKNADGPRYRLFDFSSYMTSTYDVDHPISINYSCIYGLDDCSTEKVYSITLTSLAMNISNSNQNVFRCKTDTCANCSLTYTISVNPARYNEWNKDSNKYSTHEYENWSMTIATALYPSNKDIYVLWEQENTTHYKVKLMKESLIISEKKTRETHATFVNVPAGTYKIQILCHSDYDSPKTYTTFHSIEITQTTDPGMSDKNSYAVIASVSGCILGILLAGVVAFIRCRNEKNLDGTGIEQTKYTILMNKDPASVVMSEALERAFKNLNIVNVEHTSNLNLERSLYNSVLLLLIPAQHDKFKFRFGNDSPYKKIIESLAERRKTLVNFRRVKVYLVYFPFIKGTKPVQWSCLQSFKRISLMGEFNKMLKLLKIKHNDEISLGQVRSDLQDAVNKAEEILTNFHPYDDHSNQTTVKFTDFPGEYYEETICPVHGRYTDDFHLRSFPQEHSRILGNQHGSSFCNQLPNNTTYVPGIHKPTIKDSRTFEHETRPLLETSSVIPPSPCPSERGSKIPPELIRMDSGYGPSRQVSSSLDNNPSFSEVKVENPHSLEDDDSLNEAIMKINEGQLNVFPTRDKHIDPMLEINFL